MEWFKLTIELMGILAWPLFALVSVLLFRKPLHAILEILPDRLASASKVSVGSLSLEIEAKANALGRPDIAEALRGIGKDSILFLLRMEHLGGFGLVHTRYANDETFYAIPALDSVNWKTLVDLADRRLIDFKVKLEEFREEFEEKFTKLSYEPSSQMDVFQPGPGLSEMERKELCSETYNMTAFGQAVVDTLAAALRDQLE